MSRGFIRQQVGGREDNDFYCTDPRAVEAFLNVYNDIDQQIWEPANGIGHISDVLTAHGYNVRRSDLIKRTDDTEELDFLSQDETFNGDIFTNPPYKYAVEFIEKAYNTVTDGHKVIMLLRLLFLESTKRQSFFKKYPPKYIYVSSKRINCAKPPFDFDATSAVAYGWFIWEKGYKGEPIIRWI